ncbi:MAG: sugar phosphate nucleotidyltransferase [Candidatus Aenigmatarchaeota archaeon]
MVHELLREISNEEEMKKKYVQVGEHLYVKPGQGLKIEDRKTEANKVPVVFAMGGSGSRLVHVTRDSFSKHMIPINWQPLSKYTFDAWRNLGFKNFRFLIDNTHRGNSISEYYGDGSNFGTKNLYSVEPEKLGSGGAIKLALQNKAIGGDFLWHQPDDMIVRYKNFPLDFANVFLSAINQGFKVAILCTPGTVYPYGEIIDENGKVTDFVEKPFISKDSSVGIWGISSEALGEFTSTELKVFSYESTVFKKLAKSGEMCKILIPNNYWIPVNDDPNLKKFEELIKSNGH